VTRVEGGQRAIRLGEARAVAEILGTSIDRLTEPTEDIRTAEALAEHLRAAKASWSQIATATDQTLRARAALALLLAREPASSAARIVEAARDAELVLRDLTPDAAVTEGYRRVARDSEFLADRHHQKGTIEIRPAQYREGAEAIAAALSNGQVVDLDLGTLAAGGKADEALAFAKGAVLTRGGGIRWLAADRYQLTPAGW
jgi:hypothetical protein